MVAVEAPAWPNMVADCSPKGDAILPVWPAAPPKEKAVEVAGVAIAGAGAGAPNGMLVIASVLVLKAGTVDEAEVPKAVTEDTDAVDALPVDNELPKSLEEV